MESQRSFLVIGLLLVSFLLWQQWQIDYGPKPVAQVSEQPMGSMASDAPSSDAPSSSADVPASSEVQNGIPLTSGSNSAQLISVQTDTFDNSIIKASIYLQLTYLIITLIFLIPLWLRALTPHSQSRVF